MELNHIPIDIQFLQDLVIYVGVVNNFLLIAQYLYPEFSNKHTLELMISFAEYQNNHNFTGMIVHVPFPKHPFIALI